MFLFFYPQGTQTDEELFNFNTDDECEQEICSDSEDDSDSQTMEDEETNDPTWSPDECDDDAYHQLGEDNPNQCESE